MISDQLVFAATSDISGITRGKSFPKADIQKRCKKGVGWTHTNVMITCFDGIGDSPYGSFGDLALVPDNKTQVSLNFKDGSPVEVFMLGDIVDMDGLAWSCCTRSILKMALDRLHEVSGITLVGAFEHEFQFKSETKPMGNSFSFAGFAERRDFAQTLMAALNQSGLVADSFMREFGPNQFEVTVAPDNGLKIADNAVLLREITRLTARQYDDGVTFSPIRDPENVGNGVHVHMSFIDDEGKPVTRDANHKYGMSQLTGSFIAGILKYADSIIALTAPSAISYLRLTPHRWSAAYNNLGYLDREAVVRICPVSATDTQKAEQQYNFEFRAADSAASPHLALAALVHAGAQGIEEKLPMPEAIQEDLSLLSASELSSRGYVRLPETLEAALENFKNNNTVTSWFGEEFSGVYVSHKQAELEHVKDMSAEERCEVYENVY